MATKENLAKALFLTLTIAVGSAIGVTVGLYAYDKLTSKSLKPTAPKTEE